MNILLYVICTKQLCCEGIYSIAYERAVTVWRGEKV